MLDHVRMQAKQNLQAPLVIFMHHFIASLSQSKVGESKFSIHYREWSDPSWQERDAALAVQSLEIRFETRN